MILLLLCQAWKINSYYENINLEEMLDRVVWILKCEQDHYLWCTLRRFSFIFLLSNEFFLVPSMDAVFQCSWRWNSFAWLFRLNYRVAFKTVFSRREKKYANTSDVWEINDKNGNILLKWKQVQATLIHEMLERQTKAENGAVTRVVWTTAKHAWPYANVETRQRKHKMSFQLRI